MSEELRIAAEVVGGVMLVFSVWSMNVKKMHLLTILQCIANLLVVVQYGLRGELSASGVCALGAVETLVLFFMNKNGKKPNVWFTAGFTAAGLLITVTMIVLNGFKGAGDIISIIALIAFNLAVVQTRSSVSRIFLLINSSLWLSLNIVSVSVSMIFTYSILVIMAIVGIIRLDRAEWQSAFRRLFRKGSEENTEKAEENV